MAFTKGPSGAVVASPGGRSAGRDSDPWYGDELGVAARLGADQEEGAYDVALQEFRSIG